MRYDRGQAHTLEGLVAALLLLTSLLFALQMTAVTPLSASTSSQHIQNQQRAIGSGVLAAAEEQGALKTAVLFWNETGPYFHGARNPSGNDVYSSEGPPNRLGTLLDRSLSDRGIAYNVDVHYLAPDGSYQSRRMVFQGFPSDNAVTVSRTVVLTDGDVLYTENEAPSSTRLVDGVDVFYAPDASPDTGLYNVVRVEVTIWRI